MRLEGSRVAARLGEAPEVWAEVPGEVASGRVGVIATTPARFRRFEVRCEPEVVREVHSQQERDRREAAEAGAGLPRPVLWKRVDLGPFGTDRNLRVADLDGDGELELVLAQKMDRLDGGNYPLITCIAALKLSGDLLWRIGEPTPERTYATADLCFQVHDLDGCGRPEVVFAKDFCLQVADGRTGEVKLAVPTPPARADGYMGGPHFARNSGDSLFFTDLEGRGRAANVVLKDRYSNFWVYNDRLELLWERSCNTGHYPAAYDLDGDGVEELLVGYSAFRGDGTLMWDLGLGDHCDGIAVGRFAGPQSEVRIAMAAGEEGFRLVTADGGIIATHTLGHVQKLTAARLRGGAEEVQFCTITYWGEPGVTATIAADGTLLHEWELFHYASALPPVNWSGDGVEQILLSAHPQTGGLMDGWGRRVLMLPDDGHPTLCSAALDLTGDPRDEILCWDFDRLWVYTQADGPCANCYRPRRNPSYNESNYKAHVSLPW